MPTVAVLRNKLKIIVFWGDHSPPHFHADYQNRKASISIKTLEVKQSANPRRRIPIKIQQEMLKWGQSASVGAYAGMGNSAGRQKASQNPKLTNL